MNFRAKRILFGVLASAVAVTAGCGNSLGEELATHNDRMAASNRRLAKAAFEFRKAAIEPLTKNQDVNALEIDRAYSVLVTAVNELKEQRKNATTPAATIEPLHKAYDEFFQVQERLVIKEFADIRDIAKSPATHKERVDKITPIVGEIQKQERNEHQKVQQAQSKFSTDANMRIIQAIPR